MQLCKTISSTQRKRKEQNNCASRKSFSKPSYTARNKPEVFLNVWPKPDHGLKARPDLQLCLGLHDRRK